MLDYFLLLYFACLFILILSLIYSVHKFPKYLKEGRWVSDLGRARRKSSKTFNLAIKLFGLLSLALVFKIIEYLPNVQEANILIITLLVTSISTILVGIFPMDKKLFLHEFSSVLVFGSVVIASVISIILNSKYDFFPSYLLIFNYIFILLLPIAIVCNVIDFFKVKKVFPKLYIRVGGLVEWTMFLMCIGWNFGMVIFFLTK